MNKMWTTQRRRARAKNGTSNGKGNRHLSTCGKIEKYKEERDIALLEGEGEGEGEGEARPEKSG